MKIQTTRVVSQQMKLELADDQLQRHRRAPRMEVGKKTAAGRHMGERKVLNQTVL